MCDRYLIQTLKDFLKVPPTRRAACLAEFEAYLAWTTLTMTQHPGYTLAGMEFTWIDDGCFNRDTVAQFLDRDGRVVSEERTVVQGYAPVASSYAPVGGV